MERTATHLQLENASAERKPRYRFQLATRGDDADLRKLLRETPMEGSVRVTLRREPSYFDALRAEGPRHEVLTVRDETRIVGMGARSVRLRYIDGHPTPVGYLSGLRLRAECRKATLLARGYRMLRKLHEDGQTECYLTTIAEGNVAALTALTSARAGLPTYYPLCRYHTYVLPLHSVGQVPQGVTVRPLTSNAMPAFLDFLRQQGQRRPFFPVYTAEDFRGPDATFQGLSPDQILTAWIGSQLVGTLGVWDQTSSRQTVVEGYSPAMRCLRPALNAWARLRGWPRFPAAGNPFPYVTAAIPLVAEDRTEVFNALLAAVAKRKRFRNSAPSALMVGTSEHDALRQRLRRRALFCYTTRIFLVFWDNGIRRPERFANRDVYLELGCL